MRKLSTILAILMAFLTVAPAWAVSFGALPLTSTNIVSALNAGPSASALTFTRAAQAGSEIVQSWNISDDAVANVTLKNGTSANNSFIPWLNFNGSSTNTAAAILANAQTDTGGAPIYQFNATASAAQVTVRPVFDFQNNGVSKMTMAAGGGVTFANQITGNGIANTGQFSTLFNTTAIPASSPGLSVTENHSAGGSEVNFWNTNSSAAGFDWWNLSGGSLRLMYLNSLGTLNLLTGGLTVAGTVTSSSGQVVKTRTATTTPVTVATTDYIVGTNMAAASAVSVVLPAAAGNAGLTFTIKDEKGDAAANNITLSVTGGGNINGAATFVIANAYGGANVYSNGTQWFTH